MDEKDDTGFTIRDRRTSAPEGGAPRTHDTDAGEAPHGEAPAQDMDFSTFVLSIASTAQMSLGSIPHPETNKTEQNVPAAKQMIDILALLQDKTKGNLTEDESALLDQVLYSLRIHYVRTIEEKNKSGG